MNKSEAIEFAKEQQEIFGGRMGEFLKFVEDELTQTNTSNTLNALDCVDTISRQAAIEEIHKYFMSELDKEETHRQDGWEVYANMPHVNELLTHNQQISIRIKALPSTERRGHWIADDDEIIRGHCSVCGWTAIWQETDVYGSNFCPNCGARMEEEKS